MAVICSDRAGETRTSKEVGEVCNRWQHAVKGVRGKKRKALASESFPFSCTPSSSTLQPVILLSSPTHVQPVLSLLFHFTADAEQLYGDQTLQSESRHAHYSTMGR
jgi:hypothetical protein